MKYVFSVLLIFSSFTQAHAAIGCLPGECGSHGGGGRGDSGSPTSPRPLPPSNPRPPSRPTPPSYREFTAVGRAEIFSPGCDRDDRDDAEKLAQRRAYEIAIVQLGENPKLISNVSFTSSCGTSTNGKNDLWEVEARAKFSN